MDDETLTESVRKYSVIYDTGDAKYLDSKNINCKSGTKSERKYN